MSNQDFFDMIRTLLPLLIPIILVQLGLVIYAIVDLLRRKETNGPRWAWGVALFLFGFGIPIGMIVAGSYLIWGRNQEA
ncbi:MAG: PLDc_N domain-containing protein [Chloroflexota bacterium]|nr:MAG: PLDc_N domain-containing protein [Chloroflexota bacterium]